ncbi:homoserine O-acetyltransferase [Spirulina subsalsa FACHB-351]|uniref:Homoserine O-acetyltransferase n=1 Tax=Spirulina subsalsa FACHB-351 TaxID=234711 RepID=A0ABT3L0Z1_9CYAN|nr:homoserine O-acetyltransferase [Spirulina subsalsa]MCW6035173.1 homoserine O-acetyltransferase [Spirulina subsalsa FACHB-351]
MNYQQLISPQTQFYRSSHPFPLVLGGELPEVQVAYRTWGRLNESRDNGVLICHAFTGWADLEAWWQPLLGPGKALDPTQDFLICSNILGSCYGTTGPTSLNPKTGKPYGVDFPEITVRDMVHLQARLLEELGVRSLRLVIGGSLGGMQVLEWAACYPDWVKAIAPIAASGRHSAWCIGWSEAQRQAIYTDPLWQEGHYSPAAPPKQGLKVARMIAMSTYRSWGNYSIRFARNEQGEEFAIAHYLKYQGDKLVERFDANTYIALSHAMDQHNLARPDQDYETVLQSIPHPTLIVGIDSDILYPPVEQQELAELIPNAQLAWLHSPHGHDAFLINMDELNQLVLTFRQSLHTNSIFPSPCYP